MRKIIVTGWKIGFQKIEFTKLLKSELGYSLTEAKALTDAILDHKPVHLELPDSRFDPIVRIISRLGAVFHEEA